MCAAGTNVESTWGTSFSFVIEAFQCSTCEFVCILPPSISGWHTLTTDQLFNLEFQFESGFKLEFQPKFGLPLGFPIPMGIDLGECTSKAKPQLQSIHSCSILPGR